MYGVTQGSSFILLHVACFPVINFIALKSALSQVNIIYSGRWIWQYFGGFPIIGFPGVFHCQSCHIEPPTVYEWQFIVSYSGTASRGSFLSLVFMLVYADSLCGPAPPILGKCIALGPPLFSKSKKRCWFFSLFSFLLFVKLQWWLPISLLAEPDTGSLSPEFFCETPYSFLLHGIYTVFFFFLIWDTPSHISA